MSNDSWDQHLDRAVRLAAAEAEVARLKLVTYPTPLERKLVQRIKELTESLAAAEAHCLDVHGTECELK